jgi:hypothetical protein
LKGGKATKYISRILILITITFNPLTAQWVQTNIPYRGDLVSSLVLIDTILFAGTDAGVFLSKDNGETWTIADSGLTNTDVMSLVVKGKNIFAGTYDGVFHSTDNGTSWTAANSGLENTIIRSLVVCGNNLYAGIWGGVFLSTNNGKNWTDISSDLTNQDVWSLAIVGTYLFAGTTGGLFYTNVNSSGWIKVNLDQTNQNVTCLAVMDTNLFAGIFGAGVFLSSDYGKSWTAVESGLTGYYMCSFVVNGINLFIGTNNGGVFLSVDKGINWTNVNTEEMFTTGVSALTSNDTFLFVGTGTGTSRSGVWRRSLSEMATAVNASPTELPSEFRLEQNYPNPFNPSTTIEFDIPTSGFVSLKVFNIMGQEVATLLNKELQSGNHKVEWKPENLSSGLYFYKLQTKGYQETKKLIFMK